MTVLLRQLWELARELPAFVADRIDEWLMRAHRPQPLEGSAWCLRCGVPWPCPEFVKADNRHARRVVS